jgi:FAD/FMN-containing dehydrogenase
MNKLAQYLNQHLVGEVLVDDSVLERFATDNSPLSITPEMVVYPRSTNDIRKLLRFVSQLAEKGHQLPVTARGYGTNGTGAAIGRGVIVSLSSHMHTIFEYDAKQRLVRLQPGTSTRSLKNALRLHGTSMPFIEFDETDSTVGGLLSNSSTALSKDSVNQLEVVLSNGDNMQTKRLSKRDLNKIKGKQSFEADIYRAIDGLIDERKALIDQLDDKNMSGYASIADVKQKDGSLDLTPLFLGSQGTLGIISEMILKSDYVSDNKSIIVGATSDPANARDLVDDVAKIKPAHMMYFDAATMEAAQLSGKTFAFTNEVSNPTVVVAIFNDISARNQAKKLKKAQKLYTKHDATVATSADMNDSEFASVFSIISLSEQTDDTSSALPMMDNAYVPPARFEDFSNSLFELSKKLKIDLPLHGQPLEGLWTVRPKVNLKTVGGKQAVFKLIEEYSQLVERFGGYLAGGHSEGRLQTYSTYKTIDDEIQQLYIDIKNIFDPAGVLNSDVKQKIDVKDLVKSLRSSFRSQSSDALPRR